MSQPDYSWAEYLDYMEGGGSDVLTLPSAPAPAAVVAERKAQSPLPGIALAVALTVAAIWISERPFAPFTLAGNRHPIEPVMVAIILGMLASNFLPISKAFLPGIKFSVKKVLPLGIVLLGARLNFNDVMQVGREGLLLSVLETGMALILLMGLTRIMGLPNKLGTLLGVGTAICGGTAIVATAPVIEAEEKDVAFSVATVTLLGLIAMFALPVIGHFLNLGQKSFGVWAGLAIHQTPQVVAAGFAYGDVAGETATIVKLARVCLLAPVVFVIGLVYAKRQMARTGAQQQKRINYLHLFPTFVLGFLGLALLNTGGLLPMLTFKSLAWGPHAAAAAVHQYQLASISGHPGVLEQISKFCIAISMAGVGLETRFASMRQTGLKPFMASLIAVVILAVVLLVLIRMFHI
jgi:uncharacterized integral membrane protein (TIGR00698 family)